MAEVFDLVPANKVLVGMDCGTAEGVCGTTLVTRQCLARVLAAKLDSGLVSRQGAATLVRRFLHDNAVAIFGRPDEKARLDFAHPALMSH